MYQYNQYYRTAVVYRKFANQRHRRKVLKALGQVFHPCTACIYVHHATQNAVCTQRKNQRWHLHNGNTPAVDQANDDADDNADCKRKTPIRTITQKAADNSRHKAEVRANGNVDFPDKYRESHAYRHQRIHNGGIEARRHVIHTHKTRVQYADNDEQAHQKQETCHFPRLENFLCSVHASAPPSNIPNEAAIRLS